MFQMLNNLVFLRKIIVYTRAIDEYRVREDETGAFLNSILHFGRQVSQIKKMIYMRNWLYKILKKKIFKENKLSAKWFMNGDQCEN